jgi:hypothetical protein
MAMVFLRGRAAVRRFEWTAEGQWWVADRTGNRVKAQLTAATAGFGPLLLLIWWAGGRRYALVDACNVSPEAFRALRGRLKLQLRRPEGRSVP